MPLEVGPRTLRRAPALYEYNKEDYAERIEPLRDDLNQRALKHFFSSKPKTLIGEVNE